MIRKPRVSGKIESLKGKINSVPFFLSSQSTIWWLAPPKKRKNYFGNNEKKKLGLNFNPGLTSTNRPANNWVQEHPPKVDQLSELGKLQLSFERSEFSLLLGSSCRCCCFYYWRCNLIASLRQPSPSISTDQDETVKAAEMQGSTLLERMIEALHMELLFIRHRIAVKLSNLGKETVEQKKSAKKQKVTEKKKKACFGRAKNILEIFRF